MTAKYAAVAYCAEINREAGAEAMFEAIYEAGQATAAYARKHVWTHPKYAELQAKRSEEITTPCTLRSCDGRCSRCVRAQAVQSNIARYGSPDRPGRPA